MLELTSAGWPVFLTPGTSVQVERHSPCFDEDVIKGEFTYSFAVPAAPNGPLYNWPERADRAQEPGEALPAELAYQGLPLLTGAQRVTAANPSKYTVSVQGGLSGAALSGRLLSSFAYGGVRLVERQVYLGLGGGGNPVYGDGLVAHANAVVAAPADYDYVFAPLRNEYLAAPLPYTPDPLDYPPATTNPWNATPTSGGFVATSGPGPLVMGLPPVYTLPATGGYCPFPRLRYVLRAILEEAGFEVDVAQLLPGGLGELVIVGNAQLVDRGDWQHVGWHLADVVPALTVAQLLAALRADLGIIVYVDPPTQRVRTGYLVEQVAAETQDLTAYLAGYPDVTPGLPVGVTLTYHVDSEDALSKDLLDQQPAPELVLPAVATVADLPATAALSDNPQAGQVRLVEERGTYYACTLGYLDPQNVSLLWSEQAESLPAIAVQGGGEEQAQQLCYTVFKTTRLFSSNGSGQAAYPAISQAPYRADLGTVARSSALRLLFYNGLQLASDGQSYYPQLSLTSADQTLSLRLTGSTGTYATWLRTWLPVKLRATTYKQPLLLPALELARLDLSRPVQLDGVRYLARQLTLTVPSRKPAVLELVRL